MHLEDRIKHISASYPNTWALTGLHFNDDASYQLASYFKSRYTIYYQHGSNSFGGVCLAIAREVPHRITSEFNNINNLIADDVFNSKKIHSGCCLFSTIGRSFLNRLHQYNRNLILIGDLNARHPNWHDVTSNACAHPLAEWIDENQNLKIFHSSKPTSTRSRAVIDLIIAPSHVSSDFTESDQKMHESDHYPVHWRLSTFHSLSTTQLGSESIEFILLYEVVLADLQERCTTYHMADDTSLFAESYHTETQNCLSSADRLFQTNIEIRYVL